jgi:hypothetical protein
LIFDPRLAAACGRAQAQGRHPGRFVAKVSRRAKSSSSSARARRQEAEQEVDMLDLPYDFDSLIAGGQHVRFERHHRDG